MFEIDQNESSLTLVGWAAFVFVKFFRNDGVLCEFGGMVVCVFISSSSSKRRLAH